MKYFYLKSFLLLLFTLMGMSSFANYYYIRIDDFTYDLYQYSDRNFASVVNGPNISSVIIPETVIYNGVVYNVEYIDEKAFENHYRIESVVIPQHVTLIGRAAFYNCINLTSISIPESVREIKGYAFYYCTKLAKAEFGSIESLCNITFGSSLDGGIYSNPLLYAQHLYINGEEITNVTIPESINRIKEYTFTGCTGLISVTIHNNVTAIASDAFSRCTGLTSITIPESVNYIGRNAFYGCTGLTSITIPESVNSIGENAFYGCTGLNLVFCNREVPPLAYSNTFPKAIGIVPAEYSESYKKASGWNNLQINNAFKLSGTTQTTITLATDDMLSNQEIIFNGQTYTPVNSKVQLTNLSPGKQYTVYARGNYGNLELNGSITAETLYCYISLNLEKSTNTTLTVEAKCNTGDATVRFAGFDNYGAGDKVTITGLPPGETKNVSYILITDDNSRFTKNETFQTQAVNATVEVSNITATTATLQGTLTNLIDATVESWGFKENDYKSNNIKVTGLIPESSNTLRFKVTFNEGGMVEKDVTFNTDCLTFTTLQPKVISMGNVIVSASSNIDDDEDNVGFEWRRTDWPDDFASNSGTGYLYEGTMEGYIHNLNAEKLWRVRPYYESSSGNRYYGNWVGFDPSNTSYFEPTVHTYATANIEGNTAEVKGYVMRGTDNVAQQGFKYWKQTVNARSTSTNNEIPSNAMTVEATGQVMKALLTNLDYDLDYCYVAFVTTSKNETFYGETKLFRTNTNTNGVEELKIASPIMEQVRYDLRGYRLNTPKKGINIIRMSDGTIRKVMVK
ncbi:MAG: leucine-rich repeat domain-containing protein [Prevotella sp.]|nr:leucine-rich repeat domain-containing protein [Prevotella sp.]